MRLPRRVRWSHVRRLYEAVEPSLKASPAVQDGPDKGPVLVLAPHIDDDVIGAGGSIMQHVVAGDRVTAVYLADCTTERIEEARRAAEVTGVDDLRFLGYQSKTLLDQPGVGGRIDDIITEVGPAIVYLPSLFDRHNDHLAVNHLIAGSIRRNAYDFTVCGYEVWTALVPNLVVDITPIAEKKREALGAYASQLSGNNWVDAALGLNRYRGVTSGAGAYAEGFMRYSAGEYLRIWKSAYGK